MRIGDSLGNATYIAEEILKVGNELVILVEQLRRYILLRHVLVVRVLAKGQSLLSELVQNHAEREPIARRRVSLDRLGLDLRRHVTVGAADL